MSDTPRTDVAYAASTRAGIYELFNESQSIERELNAANERFRKLNIHALTLAERIMRLEEFVDQLTNPKFTSDDLPEEALLQRIKRLEEVLGALTLVVGLTPIAGNKDALQEVMDMARSELKAKEAP